MKFRDCRNCLHNMANQDIQRTHVTGICPQVYISMQAEIGLQRENQSSDGLPSAELQALKSLLTELEYYSTSNVVYTSSSYIVNRI